jgi:hypothetical protein
MRGAHINTPAAALQLLPGHELTHCVCTQEAALGLEPGTAGDAEEDDEGGLGEDPAAVRARQAAEAGARPPIYNAEALHEKLEDISWPSEVRPAAVRRQQACCMGCMSKHSGKPQLDGWLVDGGK